MKLPQGELSLEREELLRHILEDDTLSYCQEHYPAAVKLQLVRRTRAILTLHGEQVRYHLSEQEEGQCELTAEAAPSTLILKTEYPALWGLGMHIAAEAMLALRNGHKEYVRVRKRKTIKGTVDY